MACDTTSTRWSAVLACLFVSTSGCYSYSFQERGPKPDFARVKVDDNKPYSDVRWSTVWGGNEDLWFPVGCFYADGSTHTVSKDEHDPACVDYYELCEQGVGRVDVELLGYSIPLAILTLGFAMPAETTVSCKAGGAPSGPIGPGVSPDAGTHPGPGGPIGP